MACPLLVSNSACLLNTSVHVEPVSVGCVVYQGSCSTQKPRFSLQEEVLLVHQRSSHVTFARAWQCPNCQGAGVLGCGVCVGSPPGPDLVHPLVHNHVLVRPAQHRDRQSSEVFRGLKS
jgi:hypothetical protein